LHQTTSFINYQRKRIVEKALAVNFPLFARFDKTRLTITDRFRITIYLAGIGKNVSHALLVYRRMVAVFDEG